MDGSRGTFTSAHELLDRLRARQAELGLSNEALEEICEFAPRELDKYLGPARTKFPGLLKVCLMMDALGLSGTLYVDARKVERAAKEWREQGRRRQAAIRSDNPRVSQAMVRRAAPAVAAQMGRKGGERRWLGTTKADIDTHIARMNAARLRKRLGAKRR
jgi:hypothetical protein